MGKISRRTFLKAATSTAALAAGVSITGTAAGRSECFQGTRLFEYFADQNHRFGQCRYTIF